MNLKKLPVFKQTLAKTSIDLKELIGPKWEAPGENRRVDRTVIIKLITGVGSLKVFKNKFRLQDDGNNYYVSIVRKAQLGT